MTTVAEVVALTKREILEDIRDGTVPATVKTFSELHDYVDANCYGGLCDSDLMDELAGDDGVSMDRIIDFANEVQGIIDQWIKLGMPEDDGESDAITV